VLLDLREGSDYGRHASVHLEADRPHLLWIPKGVAHGFLSLTDHSLMVYKTSAEHVPTHDAGVRFDSFGFEWGVGTPQLSERDLRHPALADFRSPFLP
jgi:dTDP-4-dehydrorhamnose 3,5-epimerase